MRQGFDKLLLKQPKKQEQPEWPPVDLRARGQSIRIKIFRNARLHHGREIVGSIYPNRMGGWQSSKEFFCTFTVLLTGTYADIRFKSSNSAFSTESMRASRRVIGRPTQEKILKTTADAFAVLLQILDRVEIKGKTPF